MRHDKYKNLSRLSRLLVGVVVVAGALTIFVSVDFKALGQFYDVSWAGRTETAPPPVLDIVEEGQIGGVKDVSSINLFSEVVDEETGLKIVTGTHFENVIAVNDSRPSRSWCYTLANEPTSQGGPLLRRINLGLQQSYDAPQYVEAYELTAQHTSPFNVSPEALLSAAKRSCSFPEK